MKKLAISIALLGSSFVNSHAIEQKSYLYLRNGTPEVELSNIAIGYFNPAGTAFMQPGKYFQSETFLGVVKQSFTTTNEIHVINPSSSDPVHNANVFAAMPALYAGYITSKWSAFMYYNFDGGTATPVSFDRLLFPVGGNMYLEGKTKSMSFTNVIGFGGAYKLNEKLAVAARGEFLYRIDNQRVELYGSPSFGKASGSAMAIQPSVGLDFRPDESNNFSITLTAPTTYGSDAGHIRGEDQVAIMIATGAVEMKTYNPFTIRSGFSHTFRNGLKVATATRWMFWDATGDHRGRTQHSNSFSVEYPLTQKLTVTGGIDFYSRTYKTPTYTDQGGSLILCNFGADWKLSTNRALHFGLSIPDFHKANMEGFRNVGTKAVQGNIAYSMWK